VCNPKGTCVRFLFLFFLSLRCGVWLCRLLCLLFRWLVSLGRGGVRGRRRCLLRLVALRLVRRCLSGVLRGLTRLCALGLGRVVGCSLRCRVPVVVWRRVRLVWFGRWRRRVVVGCRFPVGRVRLGCCPRVFPVAVSVGWVRGLGLRWRLRSGWGFRVWCSLRGGCLRVGGSVLWVGVGLFGFPSSLFAPVGCQPGFVVSVHFLLARFGYGI
jgi:hypothetical protein